MKVEKRKIIKWREVTNDRSEMVRCTRKGAAGGVGGEKRGERKVK